MLIKRSFSLAGHRTSVALEAEFWAVLEEAARGSGGSFAAFVACIDAGRTPSRSLASALRLAALAASQTNLRRR